MRISEANRRVDLNPRDPSFVQDPYAAYAVWRQRCPIFFWDQLGHWCLARYDDVDAVLRDRRFGRQILHLATREELGWPEPAPHLAPVRDFERHSLLELEPPEHTRLRAVVNPAFLPRAVAGLAPLVAGITNRLIDDMTAEPGGRADLRADPAGHVEEMLRFDPPLHLFTRYALTDLEFRGCRLRRGDRLGLLLGAANRDPGRFVEPDSYRADRRPNPHLSFGAGIHACVGAPLARLEMQIALRALCERLPSLRLAAIPAYRDTWHFHGLESLPVAWDAPADTPPRPRAG